MTSDAKIGLLLGLIFIFVIAFIINGLPRFRGVTNNSELTTTMVSTPNGTMGIGGNERRVQDDLDWPPQVDKQPQQVVQMPLEQKEDIRFKMKLPQDISFASDPLITEPSNEPVARDTEPATIQPAEPVVEAPQKLETPKSAALKEYVVADGDTLGAIAKKFYGPEEGNRLVNITRIFEANRQILKSIDDIDVGQKLTIPPLGVLGPDVGESESSLPSALFEKAVAIGRKAGILKAEEPSENVLALKSPPKSNKIKPAGPAPSRQYVVQEGDSLSRIAAQQLGDSSRYMEIAKLNRLKDPDTLDIGMQLKMPPR